MDEKETPNFTNSDMSDSLFSVTTPGLPPEWSWGESWWDRQGRAPEYDQEAVENAFVWIFGCNGLGRTAAEFVVRKGYGGVGLCDPDTVEPTNLHRTLWRHDAVGEFKAVRAMEELYRVAPGRTEIQAYLGTLQDALALADITDRMSACLVGIDNDRGRAEAASMLLSLQTPAIFYALSPDTFSYEVFVQEPGGPCWACVHPDRYRSSMDETHRSVCPKTPAIADPALVAVGLALYALDSILMGRVRSWNYALGHLHAEIAECRTLLAANQNCPVCRA